MSQISPISQMHFLYCFVVLLCCSSETMSQIAKKDSWETRPFSLGKTVTLPLSKSLTKGEFEELKKGVIPREMEDKWFVYYDEGMYITTSCSSKMF